MVSYLAVTYLVFRISRIKQSLLSHRRLNREANELGTVLATLRRLTIWLKKAKKTSIGNFRPSTNIVTPDQCRLESRHNAKMEFQAACDAGHVHSRLS